MRVYPIIFGSESQLVVIDGFIVSLSTRGSDDTRITHGRHSQTLKRVRVLQKKFGCGSLEKLQHICSNFLLTSNRLLFDIVTEKEYVTFVSKKGRYYCRKIHRSKATHIAISVRMSRKTGPRSSKYVVYSVPLNLGGVETQDLYKQQEKDLKSYDDQDYGSLRNYDIGDNEAGPKVERITKEEIFNLCGSSPTIKMRESLPNLTLASQSTLAAFKESLLQYCQKRSLFKLENLIKILSLVPNVAKFSAQLATLHKECKALILRNISMVHEEFFPSFFETEMVEKEGCSNRKVIQADQQLESIMNLSQKALQKTLETEKSRLFARSLQAGQKAMSRVSLLKSQIDSKSFESKMKERDITSSALQSNELIFVRDGSLPSRTPNCTLRGPWDFESLRDSSPFYRLKALEQVKLSVIGKEPSLEQLIRRIQIYCSYQEQKLLYLESLLSLDELSSREKSG